MSDVDVRIGDVEALAVALVRYRSATQDQVAVGVRALSDARTRMQHRRAELERAAERARRALDAAAAALRACDQDCAGLQAEVDRSAEEFRAAEQLADRAKDAERALEQAGTEFMGRVRSIRATVDDQIPTAFEALRRFSEQIGHYLSVQVSGGSSSPRSGGRPGSGSRSGSSLGGQGGAGTGASSSAAGGGGQGGQLPGDTRLIPLDRIDASDSTVNGAGDFAKVSQADMAWGVDRLDRVVLPGVQSGQDLSYFQARDAAEGLSGNRSYAAVHQAFFGSSSQIKVSARPDGSYGVINGYHRLHVAQQLGITSLPCRVVR